MKTLKELRELKGFTQAGLAKSSGVSLSWIRVIEQGGAGTISEDIQGKIVKVLESVPKEFQLRRAYWGSELFSESNPILRNPVRTFANELLSSAEKAEDSGAKFLLESCKKDNFFLTLQEILFMAKRLKVKLPKV